MKIRSLSLAKLVPAHLALALGAAIIAGGCSSEGDRYQAVKDDPTPNIDTLHQRPADVDNSIVVTFDENGRMFTQDLGRAFYWDRPSRLTREPVPRP